MEHLVSVLLYHLRPGRLELIASGLCYPSSDTAPVGAVMVLDAVPPHFEVSLSEVARERTARTDKACIPLAAD